MTIQLERGRKRFNRFNAQIVSNNNKKNDENRLIFRKVIAKMTSINAAESCHFLL